jgi:hypothetical protein
MSQACETTLGFMSTPENDGHTDGAAAAETAQRADTLDYVSDLISELREISDRLGCATLSGILGLAFTEARQQAAKNAP